MDVGATIKAVRNEYKDYLKRKNPDWSESTVSTYASDSFYVWNNTICLSFWKCFVDGQSMESAQTAILDHLVYVKNANMAEERAGAYYKCMCTLKAFLDEEYGGVRNRVGPEFDCEIVVFKCCKDVYDGILTAEEAVSILTKEVPAFNETSHKLNIMLFAAMVNGEKYTRRANIELTICFIDGIGKAYGLEKMRLALQTTQDNIKYFYEKTGNKSNAMRRECQLLADANGLNIAFDDSIFEGITPIDKETNKIMKDERSINYWIYSPGEGASKWNEFYHKRVLAIGWGGIGDLSLFDSKEDMKKRMKEIFDPSLSYMNAAHATWQFANEMQPGDIVFAKKGLHTIVGRGVVKSEYKFEDDFDDEYKNIREIEWTHTGVWDHPGRAATKTLTNITNYTDYVEKLNSIFDIDIEEDVEEKEVEYPSYTKDDFLDEVYMNESKYEVLVNLLKLKKNVILQGAPGAGKTFAAKRLAYSIMGVKDTSRVMMIQFHQSYSYEDFIMGFRPSGSGFELKKGPFYNFCKVAEIDSDNDYFFIIDEINRGNLSKIFGELFMLIEGDKRGVSLQLLYSDEKFSVPANVHIIGMMNTADRSLAMMDYALRRRFAFFEFPPAFDTDGFIKYRQSKNNVKFDNLIERIGKLNDTIEKDDTLGRGFKIGHSYFCIDKEVNDMWLDSVITYEILPLLNEYWFDEPAKVRDWENMLREAIK